MTAITPSIEQRIGAMPAQILQAIFGCEVHLFATRGRGSAGPDSDIDLLIAAPDQWMQYHHHFQVMGSL